MSRHEHALVRAFFPESRDVSRAAQAVIRLVEGTGVLDAPHDTPVATDDWTSPSTYPHNAAVLAHSHAVFRGGDPAEPANYSLAHHEATLGSAANINAVNEGLARLSRMEGVSEDVRERAAAHLRAHRVKAGLKEALGGNEIRETVERVAQAHRFDEASRQRMLGALLEQEVRFAEAHRPPATIAGDFVALRERAVSDDGVATIKVIAPGWGSSGYYSPDVLKRDGAKVYPPGTKMFWNHPTEAEEAARPEGNLYDLAAETVSEARWQDGPDGPGLYADCKVFDAFRGPVNELAPHVGVSIRADGRAHVGEAEGKRGPIVDELTEGISIDFVTSPGAGGKIVQLFESYRRGGNVTNVNTNTDPNADPANGGGDPNGGGNGGGDPNGGGQPNPPTPPTPPNPDPNADPANGGSTQTEAERRMNEGFAIRDARDVARTLIETRGNVPQPTAQRLLESLPSRFELTTDGKLDVEKFKTVANAAIDAEINYLAEAGGLGRPTNVGPGTSGSGDAIDDAAAQADQAQLQEALVALGSPANEAKRVTSLRETAKA